MAIKDRWNRFLSDKSVSSSASSSTEDHQATLALPIASTPNTAIRPRSRTSPSSREDDKPSKQSSLLSKTFPWRSSGDAFRSFRPPGGKSKKSRDGDSAKTTKASSSSRPTQRRMHPSERPLTEINLRHQEMLSAFTFKFGRTGGPMPNLGGISPCSSRRASVDEGYSAAF